MPAKQIGKIFVSRYNMIRKPRGGEKSAPGLPSFQRADGLAVVHDGVINVVEKFMGMFSQQARIAGTEHLSLEKNCIVSGRGF